MHPKKKKNKNMEIKKKFILTIVLLSYLATAINAAIVITGLENMAKDLDLNQSVLSGCRIHMYWLGDVSCYWAGD